MGAHVQESHDAAIHRLAEKARREGVRIKQRPSDGRYFATSVSHPGQLHYVTAYSCDCQGFITHQRCKHHSALLAALGWLPDLPSDPEPTPAAVVELTPARCPTCSGIGEVPTGHLGMWGPVYGPCADCQGAGKRAA